MRKIGKGRGEVENVESVPEQELFGEGLGFCSLGRFSVEDEAAGPLGAGDEEDADLAFGGDSGSDTLDVGLLAGEGDAGADVDGVLEHLEAVVKEVFPEDGGGFALVFLFHGEVEADK